MRVEERFYQITLEDYGKPAFCSFNKEYAGTIEMLLDFINALDQKEDSGAYEKGIVDTFHHY